MHIFLVNISKYFFLNKNKAVVQLPYCNTVINIVIKITHLNYILVLWINLVTVKAKWIENLKDRKL